MLFRSGHEGIEYANANLMGEVALEWDEEKTSRDQIVAALALSGFPEMPAESFADSTAARE